MSVDGSRPGLRERKKARTRATIRAEAFRLFREDGYAETTIEQIAEAADVSPSTFFRYFPTKEQLVLADDLDPIMITAIEAMPPEVPPITAVRRATEAMLEKLTPEEVAFEHERQKLLYAVPELKRAVVLDMMRNIDMIAEVIGHRTGRCADDFEVRTVAGAMIGAVWGAIDRTVGDMPLAMRALAYLDEGLPLAHQPGKSPNRPRN